MSPLSILASLEFAGVFDALFASKSSNFILGVCISTQGGLTPETKWPIIFY
jgi:hypothetical protein